MNTSPVDTLKALRAEIDGTNYGDHDPEQDEQIAALDAAIAALSNTEQIRTVMRIEHEGRTFSVDGWAGPMVLGWRDAALSGGEAVAWRYRDDVRPGLPWFVCDDPNKVEQMRVDGGHEIEPLYTTPRAVGGGMVVVPREPTEAMQYAGARSWIDGQESRPGTSTAEEAAMAYRAMLTAVPNSTKER